MRTNFWCDLHQDPNRFHVVILKKSPSFLSIGGTMNQYVLDFNSFFLNVMGLELWFQVM